MKKIINKDFNILEIFFITLSILFILALFLYPFIAKQPQKITDFHYDFLYTNTNKSGELYFLTFLTILGIGLIFFLDKNRKPYPESEEPKKLYIALIALPLIINFIIRGSFPQFFLILGVIFSFITLINKQLAIKAVFGYAFIYYACIGIFTFLKRGNITEQFVTAVSLFLYTPILWKTISVENEKIMDKTILFSQIFIPLCFLIFLRNEYVLDGNIIIMSFQRSYVVIIITIIIALMLYAIFKFFKSFKKINASEKKDEYSINDIVLITTICIIAAFRVDINLAKFIPSGHYDFWHIGEKIISWQQVIELGQIPYKEFYPPSGLFSIVNGFVLNVFFDSTATNIYRALTFSQVFYAILIACVLKFSVGTSLASLIIFILPIHSYERFHLMFLSLAILTLPAVWKNINIWLKVWGLLIIANLLNYPLIGMSLAIGGIPFAIAGIYLAFKNGEIVRLIKKPTFYIAWIAILIVIIPFIPLIFRIVSTSGISAIDSIQHDGRALLTNDLTIPNYWPHRIFQYTVTIIGLSCAIMIPAYLLILVLKAKIHYKEKLSHPLFYFSTSGFLFLIMTYTFFVIRLDQGGFNRAAGPIAIVLCMCIIATCKYSKNFISNTEKLYILIIIFSLLLPFCWRNVSFRYINKIQVPVNYVLISGEDREKIPRLGYGFMHTDELNRLNYYYDFLEKNNLWGNNFTANDYLTNYILNTKAPGAAGLSVAQGYELSKLYFNAFKDKPFISTGSINTYINYWLIFDKDIVQTPEGFWISRGLINNSYSNDELKKPVLYARFSDLYPSAYGRSMNSLRPIFDSIKIIDIKIGEPYSINMNGIDADHVYIEFNTNAHIENKYFEPWDYNKYSIEFSFMYNDQWVSYDISYGDGRLLIPIGDDSRWLYEYIEEIKINLNRGFTYDSYGEIKIFELLKLNRYR